MTKAATGDQGMILTDRDRFSLITAALGYLTSEATKGSMGRLEDLERTIKRLEDDHDACSEHRSGISAGDNNTGLTELQDKVLALLDDAGIAPAACDRILDLILDAETAAEMAPST